MTVAYLASPVSYQSFRSNPDTALNWQLPAVYKHIYNQREEL